jgi:hypothetical protein
VCKKDHETEEAARAQQRAVETLMNEYTSTEPFRIYLTLMSVVNISAKRWDASHLMVGSKGTDVSKITVNSVTRKSS